MGGSGFVEGLIQLILSWFQDLVNNIWKIFSGSGSIERLRSFAAGWKGWALLLIVVCCFINVFVHIVRWRPQWWIFRRKREIIDDCLLKQPHRAKASRKPISKAARPSVAKINHNSQNLFLENELFVPSKKQPSRSTVKKN